MMNARFVPATAMMTSAARSEMRGAFLSVNSSLQHVSMSLAAIVGGMVVEFGGTQPGQIPMHRLGWVAAAFGLFTIPVARVLGRRIDADRKI
jgi:predicted MFS family arabinose efflux permease